jgi:hypothetical protein
MKTNTLKILALVLTIFFTLSSVSFGEEPNKYDELKEKISPLIEDISGKVPEIALSDCLSVMDPLFQMETIEFLQFLDTHYSNKAATSTLNDIALMRYVEYKRNIKTHLSGLTPKDKDETKTYKLIEEYEKYRVCDGLSSAYIEVARAKLLEYVRTNVYVKKATMVQESLIPINEEMRELLFSFTKMYSYFLTFKDKLPGFLSDCITK